MFFCLFQYHIMSEDSKASENLQGADLLRAIRQIEAGISIILPKLVEFQ